MAKSRYVNTNVIQDVSSREPVHYVTWNVPDDLQGYQPDDLTNVNQNYTHVWQAGDRMDKLANRYLGDDQYGWVICYFNNIVDPFSVEPGRVILIPMDVNLVLNRLGLM